MNNRENNSAFFHFFFLSFSFNFFFFDSNFKYTIFVTESINLFLFVATSQNTNEVLGHDKNNSGNNTPFS